MEVPQALSVLLTALSDSALTSVIVVPLPHSHPNPCVPFWDLWPQSTPESLQVWSLYTATSRHQLPPEPPQVPEALGTCEQQAQRLACICSVFTTHAAISQRRKLGSVLGASQAVVYTYPIKPLHAGKISRGLFQDGHGPSCVIWYPSGYPISSRKEVPRGRGKP